MTASCGSPGSNCLRVREVAVVGRACRVGLDCLLISLACGVEIAVLCERSPHIVPGVGKIRPAGERLLVMRDRRGCNRLLL